MKKVVILIFLLAWVSSIRSNAETLSENSTISILTCGPGEELYSVFGHSAVRVRDSIANLDIVFNYGTFDFNTPNFYLKFANGQLDYLLTVSRFQSFFQTYQWEERSITEQRLNLTQNEKQQLFDALVQNAQPQNRAYRYSFFFDNCATRIRDRVFDCFAPNSIAIDEHGAGLTFRQLYGTYLDYSPWIKFGIHLLLGKDADKQASGMQEMYVPDYLYKQFKNTSIVQLDGTHKPLVSLETELLSYPRPIAQKPWYFWPSTIFIAILALSVLLTLIDIRRKKLSVWFDSLLLIPVVLAGFLFVFLWFFTKHGVTESNFNLLWSHPIVMVFLVGLWSTRKYNSIFFKFLTGLLVLANIAWLIAFAAQIQEFPDGLWAFVLALTIRQLGMVAFFNGYMYKK